MTTIDGWMLLFAAIVAAVGAALIASETSACPTTSALAAVDVSGDGVDDDHSNSEENHEFHDEGLACEYSDERALVSEIAGFYIHSQENPR